MGITGGYTKDQPLDIVPKARGGSLRHCVECTCALTPNFVVEAYPIPKVGDIFDALSNKIILLYLILGLKGRLLGIGNSRN